MMFSARLSALSFLGLFLTLVEGKRIFPSSVGVSVELVEDSFECAYEGMKITAMDPSISCGGIGCQLGYEAGFVGKRECNSISEKSCQEAAP